MKYWLILILILNGLMTILSVIFFGGDAINFSLLPDHFFSISGAYFVGGVIGFAGLVYSICYKEFITEKLLLIFLLLGLAFYLFSLYIGKVSKNPLIDFTLICSPIGYYIVIAFLVNIFSRKNIFFLNGIVSLILLVFFLGRATVTGLFLNKVLFPDTVDFDIYKIDQAYNGFGDLFYQSMDNLSPILQTIVVMNYALIILVLYFFYGMIVREKKDDILHIYRVLIIPFLVAFLLYAIIPITGPIASFVFKEIRYPYDMHNIFNQVAYGAHFVPPAARNGMPSMHFGGSLIILLIATCLDRKIFLLLAAVFSSITFCSTLFLGEHYLLDLIVALPFSMALGTALLNPPGWQFHHRWVWWGCVFCFLLWEIYLLIARTLLIQNLWLVQIFSFVSVVMSVLCFIQFLRQVWHLSSLEKDKIPTEHLHG